jgi:hypothetical protein
MPEIPLIVELDAEDPHCATVLVDGFVGEHSCRLTDLTVTS